MASILSITPESESGLLDLTSFLERSSFIGAGGFGEVYRARWLNTVTVDQVQLLPTLAIKVMRAVPLRDEATKKKREKYLKREIKLLRDVVHPNIVPLIGFLLLENDSNRPCLISLLVSNGTLKDYSINCNIIRLCELMLGVANGLYYLHRQNIVHGDVKSENVLVDNRGIPMVIDFGLSRLMEDSSSWQTSTKDGAPGTVRWQAPELMNGSQTTVTLEGDIYAFGMTCWEILKGQAPFSEYRRDAEVMFAVLYRKERPQRPQRRDLLNELWYLMEACWSEDPKSRPLFKPIILVISQLFQPENYVYKRRYTPKIHHVSLSKPSDHIIMSYPESAQWSESELWEKRELLCKAGDREALIAVGELAWIRGNQGRWDEARVLEEQLVEAWSRLDGEDGMTVQIARGNLAVTYTRLDQFDQAEQLQLSLLHAWSDELGEKHEDTLRAMASLASTIIFQDRYLEAEELLLKVKDAMAEAFSESHPDVLACMHDLAVVYSRQNRLEEEEELSLKVMEARKHVLGTGHPDTLRTINNLAGTYQDQGRWKEAERLYLEVMEARQRLVGTDHSETLRAMHGLGVTYHKQSRWKEAEEKYLKVIETRKRMIGEDHPETLGAIHNLADAYFDQSRWEEAEEEYLKVIEARKQVMGGDHPETLGTIHNLADAYFEQSRWGEAGEQYFKVIEARKSVLGEEHPEMLRAMDNLADAYCNQSRWEEAEEQYFKVTEVRKRVLGGGHPETLRAMHNLGTAYFNQSRWEEAEALYLKVLEARKRDLGENHPDSLRTQSHLADACGMRRLKNKTS